MYRRLLTISWFWVAFVTFSPLAAFANHIDTASVTADCNGYTIHVTGAELSDPGPYVVNYAVTLSPAPSGTPITITDSITVTPDPNLSFDAAITKTWASYGVTLSGTRNLTGSATLATGLGAQNTVQIGFSPVQLSCKVSCTGSVGDYVWEDLNKDGLQESGEPAIPNVTLNLYDSGGTRIQTTTTNGSGNYLFSGLCAGQYQIAVDTTTLPTGLSQTICSNQAGVGNNSNCSPSPVTLPTDKSTDLTIDFGYVPAAATKTVKIGPSSMEGAIKISNGDWVNGGYSMKSIVKGNLTVSANVTITGPCSNGGTDTVVVPLATMTYSDPAIAKDWLPTGDANSVLSWQGSVKVAGLCGGNGTLDASKGAVFNAVVAASPSQPGATVTFRFKYRDPAAKGKPNTNCLDTSDPNRSRADVCGASWSQTITVDP